MEGGRSLKENRSSLASDVFCIRFTRKELNLFLELGSSHTRICQANRLEDPYTRKIQAHLLGTNQTKIAAGRSVVNHGNKGRPFRLALPRVNYCDNSAER